MLLCWQCSITNGLRRPGCASVAVTWPFWWSYHFCTHLPITCLTFHIVIHGGSCQPTVYNRQQPCEAVSVQHSLMLAEHAHCCDGIVNSMTDAISISTIVHQKCSRLFLFCVTCSTSMSVWGNDGTCNPIDPKYHQKFPLSDPKYH